MVGHSRQRLSAQDQTRIEAAIADLERCSSAELAIAVAQRSASYAAYPALWSASAALFAGWIAALLEPDVLASHVIFAQGLVLLGVAAILYLTPIGIKLVPAAVKRARAAAMARLEFIRLVNNLTRGKDGVLLYVSVAERYVEILADDAVAAEIGQERWQKIIDDFAIRARRTRLSDNLLQLIGECAAILEARFPANPGQTNELPNRVKEI